MMWGRKGGLVGLVDACGARENHQRCFLRHFSLSYRSSGVQWVRKPRRASVYSLSRSSPTTFRRAVMLLPHELAVSKNTSNVFQMTFSLDERAPRASGWHSDENTSRKLLSSIKLWTGFSGAHSWRSPLGRKRQNSAFASAWTVCDSSMSTPFAERD